MVNPLLCFPDEMPSSVPLDDALDDAMENKPWLFLPRMSPADRELSLLLRSTRCRSTAIVLCLGVLQGELQPTDWLGGVAGCAGRLMGCCFPLVVFGASSGQTTGLHKKKNRSDFRLFLTDICVATFQTPS